MKTYYQVYYMDNEGQKQVIYKFLSYQEAVKKWQQFNTENPHIFYTNYEVQE